MSLLSKELSRVFSSTSLKISIMVMAYPVLWVVMEQPVHNQLRLWNNLSIEKDIC